MSRERPLRGSCSCGRNRYTVVVPEGSNEVAQVFFENSNEHRRHQAAPLTAFLRIPLTWYHSATYSFFPDETHATIRRAYTSPAHPHSKRHFCGYCGTPLSYWTEQPPTEADFISLTLGSLIGEDLRELEDLGLIPPEVTRDALGEREDVMNLIAGAVQGGGQQQQHSAGDDNAMTTGEYNGNGHGAGLPWFETMMEGSLLGQLTRHRRVSRAKTTRQVGGVRVEWEIVEWTNDTGLGDDPTAGGSVASAAGARGGAGSGNGNGNGNGENGSAKRKIGEMEGESTRSPEMSTTTASVRASGEGEDVDMKG